MLVHQKRALNWMIKRENTSELPPFWECIVQDRDYFNTATLKRVFRKPPCIKGGILADDMGLGKTLTAIALILTNYKDGKQLASCKKKVSCIVVQSFKIFVYSSIICIFLFFIFYF